MPKPALRISDFTERYINLNNTTPFSFKGREYFLPIYNSDGNAELFMTGRQCAKSTFLVNRQISRSCTTPDLNTLYEAPREKQSKTFSRQKLRSILECSPKLRPFLKMTTTGKIDGISVFDYDCFRSGSRIALSTTYGGADRDRGASMTDLYVDETQDQDPDTIAIIAESLSAAENPYKAWAGTPKSITNYIHTLWEQSRQIYWMIQCERCGQWQVPGHPDDISDLHRVITPKGLVCKKCERKLNMLNGLWSSANSNGEFNGWHISQLMRLVKGLKGSMNWSNPELGDGIYDKFLSIESSAKFYNEVLGFSYDSAEKPISNADLKNIAIPQFKLQERGEEGFDPKTMIAPLIMGIDWGKNNKSHTVISVSCMRGDSPHLVYQRRLTGPEGDPTLTTKIIYDLYNKFACSAIYCDHGFWFHFKPALELAFGIPFIMANFNFMFYQNDPKYMVKKMIKHKEHFFKLSRHDILHHFVSTIKNKKVTIFNYEDFKKGGFDKDYLAIAYEVRDLKDKSSGLYFTNSGESNTPTDGFHSHLYSWIGLLLYTEKYVPYIDTEKIDKYDMYV